MRSGNQAGHLCNKPAKKWSQKTLLLLIFVGSTGNKSQLNAALPGTKNGTHSLLPRA